MFKQITGMNLQPETSGWPFTKRDIPQAVVSRIYEVLPYERNLKTERRSLVANVPDELATDIGLAMGIEGMDVCVKQHGAVAHAMWTLMLQRAEVETSESSTDPLHRLLLLDALMRNFVAKTLTASEVTAMAQIGKTQQGCYQLLQQISLAHLAAVMHKHAFIDTWQCDWLALQALGASMDDGPKHLSAPVPISVADYQRQMPLHASVIEAAYAKWLDRKDWQRGNQILSAFEKGAPAFERPNAVLSSWLVVVKLATGRQISTRATLEEVLEQLTDAGRDSLVEQLFVGLCDDQLRRLYQSAIHDFQHAPKGLDDTEVEWGWTMAINLERS